MTALALLGGRASRHAVVATLGRTTAGSTSRVRDELLCAGDVFAPAHGELSLTVPLMGPYLLEHYEARRARSGTPMLALAEMARHAATPS